MGPGLPIEGADPGPRTKGAEDAPRGAMLKLAGERAPCLPFPLLRSGFSRQEQEACARRRTSVHPVGLGLGRGADLRRGRRLPGQRRGSALPPPVAGRGASPVAAGAWRWGPEPEPGALMSPHGRRRPGARLGLELRYARRGREPGGGQAVGSCGGFPGGDRANPG